MPVTGFRGEVCCNGERCRPELTPRPVWRHGYCRPCWASLSPMGRALAEWEADAAELAERVDVMRREVAALERIWGAA